MTEPSKPSLSKAERSKAWDEANPEKKKANFAAWYAKNREKNPADSAARRAADPEKARAINKKSNDKHREKRNAYSRENHAKNADAINARHAEYLKENPQVVRRYNQRRKAHQRGLPHTFTPAQEAFMFAYWQHACAICGNQQGFFWTLVGDHVIPLSSPSCPGTVASNMIPLCNGRGGCNSSKKHQAMEPWLLKRVGPQKTKKILKAIATYFAEVHRRFPMIATAAAD